MPKTNTPFLNQLYFGDCLDVVRELHEHHPEGFIDLIYIDPPFNSKRNYNVLFESIDLKDATAQKQAFADTWSNVSYIDTIHELAAIDRDLHKFLTTLSEIRGSDSTVAYLTTMAIRIHYMHKLLKSTGSFYLHCDSTMSHYLKIICDLIFGEKNYRNEIIWQRSHAHSDSGQGAKHFGRVTDTILFYAKSDKQIWNASYTEYTAEALERDFKFVEEGTNRRYRYTPLDGPGGAAKGNPYYEFLGVTNYWRYSKERMQELYDQGKIVKSKKGGSLSQIKYLDESKGKSIDNLWIDIHRIAPNANESLGYPTQKPVALLERIIKVSTSEGDLVADFFCGCGTTIAAAQKLNRKWIGADISHLAIRLISKRLMDAYGIGIRKEFEIKGFPRDIGSAKELSLTKGGRFEFQDWVVEVLLNGVLNTKKSADGGWDGYLIFNMPDKKEFAIIEVKSGNVNVKNVREFIHVIENEKAAIGIFVCFEEQVTQPMLKEAKQAGYFREDLFNPIYPKLQIITIEDLLKHTAPKLPNLQTTFKTAQRSEEKMGKGLFD